MAKLWALIQNGLVTRIKEAVTNPFHKTAKVIDVTGMNTQVGHIADAQGNTRPGPAMTTDQAYVMKGQMIASECDYQILKGVWLPKDDPEGHLFDTHTDSIAILLALASGGASHARDASGSLVEINPQQVLKAIGQHIADCYDYSRQLGDTFTAETDIKQGWPDNGKPAADAKPRDAVADRVAAAKNQLQTQDIAGAQHLEGQVRPVVPAPQMQGQNVNATGPDSEADKANRPSLETSDEAKQKQEADKPEGDDNDKKSEGENNEGHNQ